jgi:WD40 repeat protein
MLTEVKRSRTLRPGTGPADYPTGHLAWSPDGRLLAGRVQFDTVVWDVEEGAVVATIEGAERATWSPDSDRLAYIRDGRVAVADVASRRKRWDLPARGGLVSAVSWHPSHDTLAVLIRGQKRVGPTAQYWPIGSKTPAWTFTAKRLPGDLTDTPRVIAWSPDGSEIAFNTDQCVVSAWQIETGRERSLVGHQNLIHDIAWTARPDGPTLATASSDSTVRIWPAGDTRPSFVLEGHTASVKSCQFAAEGDVLVSVDSDGIIRTWNAVTWELASTQPGERALTDYWSPYLACCPTAPLVATPGAVNGEVDVWTLRALAHAPPIESASHRYVNATVILAGDSGVGKSGLGMALAGEEFRATESTHGRHIWLLSSAEVESGTSREIREVFLWDLAGQPGYRVVHQLHLANADVALVVFDSRSERDPFAGVGYWARALKQAALIAPGDWRTPARVLVAARADRGAPPVSQARIEEVMVAFGFDEYVETSAKEMTGVPELRDRIHACIPWDTLPKVISSATFVEIKQFLVAEKEAGRVLMTPDELIGSYRRSVGQTSAQDAAGTVEHAGGIKSFFSRRVRMPVEAGAMGGAAGLREADAMADSALREIFDTCIGRIEAQALIRKLRFGDFVLLQPELLDTYASAIINAARAQPDGLGSIPEEDVLDVRFPMPASERIRGPQEQLLLIATVEELLRRELAFREQTESGPQLIFPSELAGDWPDVAEIDKFRVVYEFEGPLSSVFSALVVRLSRSGRFEIRSIGRSMVEFGANTGGVCGIVIKGWEGRGELGIYFRDDPTQETEFQFDDYVRAHLQRRAIPASISRRVVVRCWQCGEPLSEGQVARRRERNANDIVCPVCDKRISLNDSLIRGLGGDALSEMDRSADTERDRDANLTVIAGKRAVGTFDVFLCHNSRDKPEVKRIGKELQDHGILPWLDEWELRPGLPWQRALEQTIEEISAAAVFIGPDGMGPWQQEELDAFLRNFVSRQAPVIPVLLPSASADTPPELPVFLRGMMWVDFRSADPDPLTQLIWGITGERPEEPAERS